MQLYSVMQKKVGSRLNAFYLSKYLKY